MSTAAPTKKGSARPLIEHLARTTSLNCRQIAQRVGCSTDYAEFIARAVRNGGRVAGPDATVPKFAHHDRHVAAVMAQGGFCAFSEPPGARSAIAVCLPMIWPEAA